MHFSKRLIEIDYSHLWIQNQSRFVWWCRFSTVWINPRFCLRLWPFHWVFLLMPWNRHGSEEEWLQFFLNKMRVKWNSGFEMETYSSRWEHKAETVEFHCCRQYHFLNRLLFLWVSYFILTYYIIHSQTIQMFNRIVPGQISFCCPNVCFNNIDGGVSIIIFFLVQCQHNKKFKTDSQILFDRSRIFKRTNFFVCF